MEECLHQLKAGAVGKSSLAVEETGLTLLVFTQLASRLTGSLVNEILQVNGGYNHLLKLVLQWLQDNSSTQFGSLDMYCFVPHIADSKHSCWTTLDGKDAHSIGYGR